MPIQSLLTRFPSQRALVVGDICLDRWCTYDPELGEASRETGIPRIAVTGSEITPGAGGTVANNLVALGCGQVSVLGVIGNDGNGFELKQALKARGIRMDLLIEADGWATFTYTKLLNANGAVEDQPRVDFINRKPLPDLAERRLTACLLNAAPNFDVILVSDQAETANGGVVTEAVRGTLARLAAQYPDKVFWVDSRLRSELFRNAILKPNEDEAVAACGRAFGETDFSRLKATTKAPFLIVTHGDRGALVLGERQEWVPAVAVSNPVDICGAGDSFSAGAALTYVVTRDPVAAARVGNLVASITIMKKGTGTATPAEVLAAAARHGIG